jgi:HSP20 family protein
MMMINFPTFDLRSSFDELDSMRRRLDNLLGNIKRSGYRLIGSGVFPLINLTEDKDNYYLRAELPGVTATDLDIQTAHNDIVISGERKASEGGDNVRFHRRERDAGKFSRIVKLPSEIDGAKIEARLALGVLTVTIPKAEVAKPRQITIK